MGYLRGGKSWIKAKIVRTAAQTSKTTIATLSLLILLFVSSFSASRAVRSFCFDHASVLVVAFAVAGEVVCDWNREKSIKERLKKFFGILLVVGLLWEIVEAVKSDKENAFWHNKAEQAGKDSAAVNKLASDANERASIAESNTAVVRLQYEGLRSNNLALQIKLQPRNITLTQVTNFIWLTTKLQKFQVRVSVGETREETTIFAWQIREMLNKAKFPPPDSETNLPFNIYIEEGAMIAPYHFEPTNDWESVWVVTDVTNCCEFFSNFEITKTNGLTQYATASTNDAYGAIVSAFNQIGIRTAWKYVPKWAGEGHIAVYVRQKPQ